MGKLHELLAVRQDRRNEANRAIAAAVDLFKNHPDRFRGVVEKFIPRGEGEEARVEGVKAMANTVDAVLKDTLTKWVEAVNVEGGIDATNSCGSGAVADLFPSEDGWLLTSLPAMFLLNMEKDLGGILKMIEVIPFLDPTKEWTRDENTGLHKNISRKVRTAKEQRPLVLYAATKEHPAQTQLITQDVPLGEVERTEMSGEWPRSKVEKTYNRCLLAIAEVKGARARANQADAESVRWGEEFRKYIFNIMT